MSSGGRIFIVMLVLAFMATGLYYLVTTRDAEPGGTEPVVLEPVATEDPVGANGALAPLEPASPVMLAEPDPLSTDVVSMRLVVPASNTLAHDVPALEARLAAGEEMPEDAGVRWFRVHDPALFADTPENMHALLADPGNYFRDRYGYVVARHDDGLWILLDDARNVLLPMAGRGVAVEEVKVTMDDLDRPAINIIFDEATRRRLGGLVDANPYRPCGVLVNDALVAVPTLNERFLERTLLAGDFTPSQLTSIRGAVEGMDPLVPVELPPIVVGELRMGTTSDPLVADAEGASSGNDGLRLMNAEIVPDASDEVEAEEAAPLAPVRPASGSKLTRYEVREGDTLSSIADAWFGSASSWALIVDANPTLDPDRLSIGQVLMLPARDATPKVVTGTAGTHIVRSGDMLSRLAKTYYGHERHWQVIYEANKELIGEDPGDLKVGTTLVIPRRP